MRKVRKLSFERPPGPFTTAVITAYSRDEDKDEDEDEGAEGQPRRCALEYTITSMYVHVASIQNCELFCIGQLVLVK